MEGTAATERYLESLVFTAPPQKLRLLMIEKAIQQTAAAVRSLEEDDSLKFGNATLQLRELLGELLSGVHRGSGELGAKVCDLYLFLLNRLNVGERERAAAPFRDIDRVLQEERETWRQVCDQLAQAAGPAPLTIRQDSATTIAQTGFSIDA